MSLITSSNKIINGLYKSNVLNRVNAKSLYHIFNLNHKSKIYGLNRYDTIKNSTHFQSKKNWLQTNGLLIQQTFPLTTNDSGKTGKNQNKSTKSVNSSVNNNSLSTKKHHDSNKNGNDAKNDSNTFKLQQQQQQFNQIKQQIQQAQQRIDNLSKSKRSVSNTINIPTLSNSKASKNINMGKSSISGNYNKVISQKTYTTDNSYMYNQDVDGKTMFQQQIYNTTSFSNPREIREYLDKYVIGQNKLKQILSVALYNHYIKTNDLADDRIDLQDEIRIKMNSNIWHQEAPGINYNMNRKKNDDDSIVLDKSNVLLVGPTGTGKTLISKTIAELLDVPFSINDATPFTQAGYVGEDAEVCIARLLQNSDYDVSRAQRGIVFIDEIDKIARRTDSVNSGQRDVSGEGVQQGLLRLLEGTNVTITVKNNHNKRGLASISQQEVYTVNTSNILFICSGAFVGLDKIIIDRLSKRKCIGFDTDDGDSEVDEDDVLKNPLNYVEPEDLIKYGLIPEFVGRLPVLANTNQLKVLDLIDILVKPKNSIVKQYKEIFKRNGIQLFFQESALKSIAELAIKKKTGARGLRRILESILNDIMYEYFGSDYRYVVVSDNIKKPLVAASDINSHTSHKNKIKHKTSITNEIINSTKTTIYKYGEEDKLMACLKNNEISFDEHIIMPNEQNNEDKSNSYDNERIKHAEVRN